MDHGIVVKVTTGYIDVKEYDYNGKIDPNGSLIINDPTIAKDYKVFSLERGSVFIYDKTAPLQIFTIETGSQLVVSPQCKYVSVGSLKRHSETYVLEGITVFLGDATLVGSQVFTYQGGQIEFERIAQAARKKAQSRYKSDRIRGIAGDLTGIAKASKSNYKIITQAPYKDTDGNLDIKHKTSFPVVALYNDNIHVYSSKGLDIYLFVENIGDNSKLVCSEEVKTIFIKDFATPASNFQQSQIIRSKDCRIFFGENKYKHINTNQDHFTVGILEINRSDRQYFDKLKESKFKNEGVFQIYEKPNQSKQLGR